MANRICSLLNIEYPVIQGGMAWVADAELAAAVTSAGGLGIIGSGSMDVPALGAAIERCRRLTDGVFGVNIMMMNPVVDDLARLVIDMGVKVVTTGAGSPARLMPAWLEAGITVIPVVASAAQAKRMEQIGASAVVAEGCEAGGHIGEVTSLVLTPSVADAVSIPVVAAGGIADGRGVAAAFMLGAEGVQIGTRFICSNESTAHEQYKAMILKAKEVDSVVTGRSGGHPVRSLKSPLQRRILKMEREGLSDAELEALAIGSLRRAKVDGDRNGGSFMAGQSAGLVRHTAGCRDIILELMTEAAAVMAAQTERGLI